MGKLNDLLTNIISKINSKAERNHTHTDYAATEHTHEQGDITGLDTLIEGVTEIAQGKCKSYVFQTVAELDTWLTNTTNIAKLKVGDVFLIVATDVPDYWWDGSAKQKLETTKVDLASYAKLSSVTALETRIKALEDALNGFSFGDDLSAPEASGAKHITFVDLS